VIFVVSCGGISVDGGAVAVEAFEDLFGGLVPHEGGGVVVPLLDPGVDVRGEFFDGAVGGAGDEIIECRRMFGDPDYLMWVAAANIDAYEDLYMSKIVGLPGVARTVSQLTMKTIKPGGLLPFR
jgi:DNA-binding Lrp family transcriptional regulator